MNKERRKYKRFPSDVEIHFDFNYSLETEVKFEVVGQKKDQTPAKKFSAVSRNISVGGMGFASAQKTRQGDMIRLEVYLPKGDHPIRMEGKVEWCKPAERTYEGLLHEEVEGQDIFETGVRLLTVNGQSVAESIHHDQTYDVDWSIVLESVFGSYRMLMEGGYRSQEK